MRTELCVCAQIALCRENLKNVSTRVLILMHHREKHLTTNTGRLAALTLPHSKIYYRGEDPRRQVIEPLVVSQDSEHFLLYPTEDALVIDEKFAEKISRPITVVVPDGSWRQASKVAKRETQLSTLPRIQLPDLGPTRYRLRREPKEGGLATYEAIARLIGIVEGSQYQNSMETLFDTIVKRTLRSRQGILVD
jgi:DTW domain-containing protein